MRKPARERRRKFRGLADPHRIAAHSFRDLHKIDAGQIEAGHVAHLHHLAERAHRAVAGIVDHHHRQRQLALRGGPQRLDRIHRRAVADQADRPDLRTAERHADRRRQPVAEAAAGHGDKTVLAAHRKKLVHQRAMRRRFLDQRGVFRHQRRERVHQEIDRNRIGGFRRRRQRAALEGVARWSQAAAPAAW